MDLSNFGIGIEKKENLINREIKDPDLNWNSYDINIDFKEDKNLNKYLPWFLKYKLKKFDDLIITNEIKEIINFIEKKQKKKGLLLLGRAGSGKTTTLNLLGEKYNLEVFEINASDTRNKKSIELILGNVLNQRSIFQKKKLIIVDEVDGVSGSKDRGGIAQIIKYIKTKNNKDNYIVFTANDSESDKIKSLKKVCINIDFENHSKNLLFKLAERIFKNENIKFNENDLNKFIEERATFDIRGFINDLQASVFNNEFQINENLEIRDYKKKIDILLRRIYYSYPEDALFSSYNSDINIDDLFLYLEENTPKIYNKNSIIKAFNELSKADVFRGRIRKWQYWRFLVYINFYLTYSISASKNDNINKISKFERNNRILKKWIYSNKYNSIRSRTKIEKKNGLEPKFIERLAKLYGVSAKKCRSNELFYFIISYKNDLNFQKEMDNYLEIDEATKKVLLNFN